VCLKKLYQDSNVDQQGEGPPDHTALTSITCEKLVSERIISFMICMLDLMAAFTAKCSPSVVRLPRLNNATKTDAEKTSQQRC